eukprot:CAMPEP_0119151592 /NCGR_PEP_ID=MMETSP1310-20130426/46544_1 /TAXON_ID=464262 /ORGANISM="Genus nov. species nov., Strain RCC2339" /LENGTH=264 /DNA_ID=CAMNT_0007143875 /DNA_START=1 /DNA_END=792 /DNA_ORIENTATION=+
MNRMNMKTFKGVELVTAGQDSAKHRRFLQNAKESADEIVCDTSCSILVQWAGGKATLSDSEERQAEAKRVYAHMVDGEAIPPVEWSRFAVHVPSIVCTMREEQLETLFRVLEFNICSRANYYIGENHHRFSPLPEEVSSNSPILDRGWAESEPQRRQRRDGVLISTHKFLADSSGGTPVLSRVQRYLFCPYAMRMKLDKLYLGYVHSAEDEAGRRTAYSEYEGRVQHQREFRIPSFCSFDFTNLDESRADVLRRERQELEDIAP